MELYYFYNIMRMKVGIFAETDAALVNSLYWGLGLGFVLWLGFFALQGIGLYVMAKNRGLKNKALAFIPFVNIWYMGQLAGECNFFTQKVKRAGMYAMIAQIITTILSLMVLSAEMYLWTKHGVPQVTELGTAYWTGLSGFSLTAARFYDISAYIVSIFQLIYEILLVVLLMGLYKRYSPKNYTTLGILALFIPAARYIVIFVLRNRQAIDFEAYMRARREAYMRQQQQYQNMYGNPYGRPYGNPYNNPYRSNPYGGAYGNPYGASSNHSAPPEEPFAEFSSSSNTTNNNNDSEDGASDGFFD